MFLDDVGLCHIRHLLERAVCFSVYDRRDVKPREVGVGEPPYQQVKQPLKDLLGSFLLRQNSRSTEFEQANIVL